MLKKVTSTDPVSRISLGIHQSTLDLLARYREQYQDVHGDDISQGMLIEEMLKDYIAGDKEFQKWLKTAKPTDRPSSGHTPETPTDTQDRRDSHSSESGF